MLHSLDEPPVPGFSDQIVAIDGKTVCSSRQSDRRAIHLVSADGCGLGLVLGQVRTADKSNEIKINAGFVWITPLRTSPSSGASP